MARLAILSVVLLAAAASSPAAADKILLVHEADEGGLADLFESNLPSGVTTVRLAMDHDADNDATPLCDAMGSEAVAAVVDLSWGGWAAGRTAALSAGAPSLHVEASNKPFLMGREARTQHRWLVES